jgi:DNA-binding IclR family transcriptional regulator
MQPVVRALRLLTALADSAGGMTLHDLAETLDLPISTVHRLATVLEKEGYLLRTTKGKRFLLGPAVQRLVASTGSNYLRAVAEPVMARLNRATGQTVYLAEVVGQDVICVAYMPGTSSLRFFVHLGRSLPLHASAGARVILSALAPSEVRMMLDKASMDRLTEHTITDHDQLLAHLETVRRRQWDICDDELESQVWAVAAPVYDLNDAVRAAVVIVAPMSTLGDGAQRESLRDSVVSAGLEISAELGAAVGRSARRPTGQRRPQSRRATEALR